MASIVDVTGRAHLEPIRFGKKTFLLKKSDIVSRGFPLEGNIKALKKWAKGLDPGDYWVFMYPIYDKVYIYDKRNMDMITIHVAAHCMYAPEAGGGTASVYGGKGSYYIYKKLSLSEDEITKDRMRRKRYHLMREKRFDEVADIDNRIKNLGVGYRVMDEKKFWQDLRYFKKRGWFIKTDQIYHQPLMKPNTFKNTVAASLLNIEVKKSKKGRYE